GFRHPAVEFFGQCVELLPGLAQVFERRLAILERCRLHGLIDNGGRGAAPAALRLLPVVPTVAGSLVPDDAYHPQRVRGARTAVGLSEPGKRRSAAPHIVLALDGRLQSVPALRDQPPHQPQAVPQAPVTVLAREGLNEPRRNEQVL